MFGFGTIIEWLMAWLLGEVKDLWKDGTIREIAKDAVEWAEGLFEENEVKREQAIDRILEKAEEAGKEIAEEGALILVEKAVQRYLK